MSFDNPVEDVVDKAARFAIEAHSGQTRKSSNTPSVLHAMEAASIVASLTEDRDVMAAAFLHDTVEDAGISIETIGKEFGKKIQHLVASETENKYRDMDSSLTWKQRKIESIEELKASEDINVKMLWLADKLSNMRSFYRLHCVEGDRMWRYFNQKDPKEHEWYYRSVADAVSELDHSAAYREYVELINETFSN